MVVAPEHTAAPAGRLPRWALALPIGFIFVSLLVLVLTPLIMERYTRPLWREVVDTAERADFMVDEIEFALAREIAGIRGFLLTGEEAFLRDYARAASEEMQVYDQLRPLAIRLGPEVARGFVGLELAAARWHAQAATAAQLGMAATGTERIERISVQQARYRDALDAAVALDATIDRAVARRREQIRVAQRIEAAITVGLGFLALAAAFVVAGLGRRLRRLTEAAERRRLEVEELMERRERLIRGLSHDLKNPLGVIDGYAELLETGIKGDLAPEQRDMVAQIRQTTRSSLDLINDLLELSRAEAGRLRIEPEPIDPRAVVQDVAEEYRAVAERAGLRLELQVPESLPVIETDPLRVRQVLRNLLSNAVKYTPAGGRVTLRAEPRSGAGAPTAGRWLALAVEDTGPGIAPEEQARIFEEFYRPRAVERRAQGTGLGLAISRRLAELLGGTLTLRSEVGRGSTFTFWLPLTPPTRPPAPGPP